jgi:four helix bundle protein
MHPFRRLTVWQKAHELGLRVYRLSQRIDWRTYPGLAQQMQRAAFSIPYNIAEGCGRSSPAQFAHALQIASGSAHELDYQLLLARDLGAIESGDHARLEARVNEVNRMLAGLRSRVLRRRPAP